MEKVLSKADLDSILCQMCVLLADMASVWQTRLQRHIEVTCCDIGDQVK